MKCLRPAAWSGLMTVGAPLVVVAVLVATADLLLMSISARPYVGLCPRTRVFA
jgi:hypothetical protein